MSSAKSKVRARMKERSIEGRGAQIPTPHASMQRAFVELSEDYKWIEVWFPYSQEIKDLVQAVPGAHFKGRDEGGPKWRVPRDMVTAKSLRDIFGPTEFWENPETGQKVHLKGLWIGDALRAWGWSQVRLERNLSNLTAAKDARLKQVVKESRIARAIAGKPIPELELPPLPTGKPHPLMVKRDPRPYQRADIKIMSIANVMNCNQPGTGKTVETIGSWVESGALYEGPILVIGPVRSLEQTWLKEILRWLGDHDNVSVYTDENPIRRAQQVEAFLDAYENDELDGPAILCVNYDWFRLVMTHKKGEPLVTNLERLFKVELKTEKQQRALLKELKILPGLDRDERLNQIAATVEARRDHKGNIYGWANDLQRRLCDVAWAAGTVDEFHKSGMNNRTTLFSLGISLLDIDLKSALSGTPMGGKPRKLWPVLNWLEPEEYSSEWRWIERWLSSTAGRSEHSKIVGGIRRGLEEEFGRAHARHLIRRTKLAVLPGLPPRIEQVIWSDMSDAQAKQYYEFSRNLEIKIEEERLSANNILSEYLRLKQFANAKQRMVEGVPYPTEDAGKLEDLWRIMDENGVRPMRDDPEPAVRAVIGSESSRMVMMIHAWLTKKGIACDTMTGDTKDIDPILSRFKSQQQEPYVIVMTIQTGGVSLDLEEASCMLQVDETWNPDDTEQFFERGDRGTRTEPLRCYIFRTLGTIQEYIAQVNEGKTVTNNTVLAIRHRIHEAEGIEV